MVHALHESAVLCLLIAVCIENMDLRTRRIFRLSLTTALSLVVAYGLGLIFAFMAPMFGFMLSFKPAPPIKPKALLALMLIVALTTGIGLLLVPLFMHFPLVAVMVVAIGLYLSFYLILVLGQGVLGLFVAMGFTLIAAAALYDFGLGQQLVITLIGSILIAAVCQWLVYPWFPEDALAASAGAAESKDAEENRWVAIRGTLIVLPVVLMALSNPSLYMAAIMKSISLAQQTSHMDTAQAGRELLGSTFVAGCLAALFWLGLSILPNLWMYFLWTLLFCLYVGSKAYGALDSRFGPTYWMNVMTTLFILLGPAIEDIANGKDVYMASMVRLSLFFFVTLYAWWTVALLDAWRHRRLKRKSLTTQVIA